MSALKNGQETDGYLLPLSHFLQTSFNNKAKMENIDEELKINIHGILPSIPEETVNGIIHALKYVGLETMSDLQFVQEEDLILVLKPIQRRKLIRAWSEQSISPIKLSNLPLQACKWKQKKCVVLLQIYAKYKAELSRPGAEEKHEAWRKIAEEVHKRCSLKCNESQCMDKIEELRKTYQKLKTEGVSKEMAILFNEAKNAFETSNDSVISPDKVSSSLSVQNCKWKKKKCLKLLQVYAKYKTEFLCPDVEELTIWKKIADELQKLYVNFNCDDLQCCNQIKELKCEYERIKNEDVKDQETAIFLDEARRAFETTGNTDSLPFQQSNNEPLLNYQKKNRIIEFHRKLLQVYAKHKTKFDCPDIEEQKVWEEIAREMRDKYSYDCGESLCRFEFSQVKCQYENFWKKENQKSGNLSYYFDEAREVFGTDKNLDNSNCEVNEIKKKVGIYVPPHLRNTENRQIESMMSSKTENGTFTIKVSNMPENITESNLQNIFKPFGTIAQLGTVKDLSGQCKYAFISFTKQENAARAIAAIDGIEHNWKESALKVEWAESSEII